MPTIVLASPKGGAGKSTSAVLLSTELAERGATVTVIDADPNKPVSSWAKKPGKPTKLDVVTDITEDNVFEVIDAAAAASQFVIVDLEGTASMLVAYAISRADLVIIPTGGSALDAVEAVKAVKLVKRQEKAFSLKIPYVILFTRTSPMFTTRGLRSISQEFVDNQVAMLKTDLQEREAFKAIFSFGGGLSNLDPGEVANIPKAVGNARAFTAEVLALLVKNSKGVQPVGEVA
jgi:chromosome partitioning protein